MRLLGSIIALCVFGWALVASAEARHEILPSSHEALPTEVVDAPQMVEVTPEPPAWVDTPIADAHIDWDQMDADNECLWELLEREQVELTFEIVWAAGVWADALGGPCLMIGEDDE